MDWRSRPAMAMETHHKTCCGVVTLALVTGINTGSAYLSLSLLLRSACETYTVDTHIQYMKHSNMKMYNKYICMHHHASTHIYASMHARKHACTQLSACRNVKLQLRIEQIKLYIYITTKQNNTRNKTNT